MGNTYSTPTGSQAPRKSATPPNIEEPNSSANHATTGGRPTGRPSKDWTKVAAGVYTRQDLTICRQNLHGEPWQVYRLTRHTGSYASLKNAMYHHRRRP
jgi:hypothetical protein